MPVSKHGLTKDLMDQDAVIVIKKLEDAGFQAFLVGGCVRDLLAGKSPKDSDIVTNARPYQIKKVFPRSILVGKRFPLVHVRVPGKRYKIIEVATFRTKYADYKTKSKIIRWFLQFFVYGNMGQDALRRDITVQSLYWRLADATIIDYHNGVEHVKAKKLQIIGDPVKRFAEDPVRVLRVIRVRAKLGFEIDRDIVAAINSCKKLLNNVSPARMFGEVVRSLHGGFGKEFFNVANKFRITNSLFPHAVTNANSEKWIKLGLSEADKRFHDGLSLSPGYLFAVILWPIYLKSSKGSKRFNKKQALKIISRQNQVTNMPKKHMQMIESIWRMQNLFAVDSVAKAKKLEQQTFFRAAFDFFLLRAKFSSENRELAEKWIKYMEMSESEQAEFDFGVRKDEVS